MKRIEKRKLIGFLTMVLIFAGTLSLWAQFAGGSGTEEDPWQIETAAHLDNVRNYLGAAPEISLSFFSGITISQHYGVDFGYEDYQIDKGLRTGLNTGLAITYPLNRNISLRTDAIYINKGSYQDISISGETISFRVTYNMDYIEVPTLLKLRIFANNKLSIYSLSGFSFAYMINSKYSIDGAVKSDNDSYPLTLNKTIDSIDRFDYCIIAGGGWETTKGNLKNFYIEYKVNFGIPFIGLPTTEDIVIEGNKLDDDPERVGLRNLSYSLSLGYKMF